MNPLLFADWRSIAITFTVVCWVAVLVLAMTIVGAAESHAAPPPHRTAMVAR
jgi:hypothetical protein